MYEWLPYKTTNLDWVELYDYETKDDYVMVGLHNELGWVASWRGVGWLPMDGVTNIKEAKAVGMAMYKMR